ncbi:MAG TPA: peptidylprolyl isomerase [Bacteroidetes bacterium]|nr:peptidylprolyl isomerase [Bacteroidota bacterium]
MKIFNHIFISLLICVLINGTASSQYLIDEVSAIVGDETIFLSDIENMVLQQVTMGDNRPEEVIRCEVFEDLLVQLLFLDQARIDSIEISGDNINRMLDERLNDFVLRAGSEENLEEYFKKSMVEIRRDLRPMMENQQLASQVQSNLASGINITPEEVKRFYESVPSDSLPLMPARVKISIIQIDPPGLEQSKIQTRQQLLDLRRRIVEGESFRALAVLYSEDEASAAAGGEIGFQVRANLDKAYADEAWSLKKNQVSKIIESEFGFHIIELIERRGDMVNTRHILIRPKISQGQSIEAKNRLDSIANLIRSDSLSFQEAAYRFSTHKDSRMNGGLFVTPDTRESLIEIDRLPREMYMVVRDMNINEISEGFRMQDESGNTVFRIIKLNKQTEPHVANLKDDYNYLQELALANKRAGIYRNWIEEKMEMTYIKISDRFKTCNFRNKGWLK